MPSPLSVTFRSWLTTVLTTVTALPLARFMRPGPSRGALRMYASPAGPCDFTRSLPSSTTFLHREASVAEVLDDEGALLMEALFHERLGRRAAASTAATVTPSARTALSRSLRECSIVPSRRGTTPHLPSEARVLTMAARSQRRT